MTVHTLGEIRSAADLDLALVYLRSDGTFGFHLFRRHTPTEDWVPAAGQPERILATEGETIAELMARYPDLASQSVQRHPVEDPSGSPESLRARRWQAGLGAIALSVGLALLHYRQVWPGMAFLTLGCLGLGWSIGGYGGGGYDASDSWWDGRPSLPQTVPPDGAAGHQAAPRHCPWLLPHSPRNCAPCARSTAGRRRRSAAILSR